MSSSDSDDSLPPAPAFLSYPRNHLPDPEDVATFGPAAAHFYLCGQSGHFLNLLKNDCPRLQAVSPSSWKNFMRRFPQPLRHLSAPHTQGRGSNAEIGRNGGSGTDAPYRKLGEYIGRNTWLRELDLTGCEMTENMIEALCQGGLKENRHITSLKINRNKLNALALKSLSQFLRNNPELRELDISNTINHSNERGEYSGSDSNECSVILSHALRDRCENGMKYLKLLSLCGNGISDIGVSNLVEALACFNPGLKGLDLSENHIGTSGCIAIADFLCQSKCRLEELNLQHNRNIRDEALQVISERMRGNATLRTLKLGQERTVDEDPFFTPIGLTALLNLVCDTSSINATYFSNHILISVGDVFGKCLDHNDNSRQIFAKINKYFSMNRNTNLIARKKTNTNHFNGNFDIAPLDAITETTSLLPNVLSWFATDSGPSRNRYHIDCDVSERPLCGFFVGYGNCPFSGNCALDHNFRGMSYKAALRASACPFYVNGKCNMGSKCQFKHEELEGQQAQHDEIQLSAVYRILLRNVHKVCERSKFEEHAPVTKKQKTS